MSSIKEPLVETIAGIEQRVAEVKGYTDISPVQFGSLLRIPIYAYPKWGIGVTKKNENYLRGCSSEAYESEWAPAENKQAAEKNILLVRDAAILAGLIDVNELLNKHVANVTVPEICRIIAEKGSFSAVDIGSGTGDTVVPVLKRLVEQGVQLKEQSCIYLIEPSLDSLNKALGRARESAEKLGKRVEIIPMQGTDLQMLSRMETGGIDVAFSNAAIHHNSFNFHLNELHRVLKEGGLFVNGDWHSSICHTPARAYWMLYALGNSDDPTKINDMLMFVRNGSWQRSLSSEKLDLRRFRERFALDIVHAFDGLNPSERAAIAKIMEFWLAVEKVCRNANEKSPILLFEAHETVAQRKKNLVDAGFEVDGPAQEKYRRYLKKTMLRMDARNNKVPCRCELASISAVRKPMRS